MTLTGTRTYVGFGFGAIQAGLLLYEAYRSDNFCRLVVAEVLPDLISNLRQAGGYYTVNIAHPDRVEQVRIGPVEINDPAVAGDRERQVAALAEAQEIGTAIPSVSYYQSPGPGSLHCLLAEGLRRKAAGHGPAAVVYSAENHNRAAEILEGAVLGEVPAEEQSGVHARVQFLNTVIGKMSGIISEPEVIREHGLATITPGDRRAFLVEAFNRILISRIRTGAGDGAFPFRRGIEAFEERENLLPFEEAKLYGHNATHALAAYIGALAGAQRITELATVPGALPFLRAAFVQESGAALIRRNAGVDPLFTAQGYAGYADDLLERMTNPYLLDTVERVGRDPARKLGWNDRLVGTMRLTLEQGIEPRRYAFGAAAALAVLDRSNLEEPRPARSLLESLWRAESPPRIDREAVVGRIEAGMERLRTWRDTGFGDLRRTFGDEADD
jgi:mannitol-1-phosphate 5-dehydrogenase